MHVLRKEAHVKFKRAILSATMLGADLYQREKRDERESGFFTSFLSHSPSQRACSLTMAKASAGESIRVTFPSFMMEKDVPICSASHGSWVM